MSITQLDACLPQTQCQRCTYDCCQDYAQAINNNEAQINQCPPGGDVTINKLAALIGKSALPLDPQFGEFQPKLLAYINEPNCIGCILCIKACPVDAIMGANKKMHTVINEHCTGCELCLPVCPTDCIDMRAPPSVLSNTSDWPGYSAHDISQSRIRFVQRQSRLNQGPKTKSIDLQTRQQLILEAVKRRQQQKGV